MNQPTDGDLRDRFAALRREDAAGAPPFDVARHAASQARRAELTWVSWKPAAALLALIVVAVLVLLRPRTSHPPLVSLATARWESPTDFLLRVPGAQYLETVPHLTYRTPLLADWRNP